MAIKDTYLNKSGLGSFLSNLKKIFLGTKTITSAVDWNTLVSTGIYHIKTTEGTNRPTTNNGTLYVEDFTSTIFQIWIPDTDNTKMYKRYKKDSWSDWTKQLLTDTTYNNSTTTTSGLMSSTDKKKLDGIAEGANKYTHPSYTAKTSGLYKVTIDSTGHVSGTTSVSKSDITALGISGSDHTHYYAGSATVGGSANSALGVKNGGSPSGSSIYITNSAVTSVDYLAAWNSSSGIQKIAISNLPVEKYTILTSGDFDDYTGRSDGITEYYVGGFGVASHNSGAFTNCPESAVGNNIVFKLKIYKGVDDGSSGTIVECIWQEYKNLLSGAKYIRYYKSSAWSSWVQTAGKPIDDTGWKTLTYGYGTSAYNSGTVPKIRRIGKMVELRGVIKNSTSFTDHDSLLKNVPSDMRPSSPVYAVQTVGSQNAQLLIKTDGNIGIEKYPGGSFPANVWISVCATWFVD